MKPVKNIGFVGLGTMGRPMASNLLRAGFALRVYDVNDEAVRALEAEGATAAASAKEAAQGVELVITMLPDTPQVEEVIRGESGVGAGAAPGTIVVDMSTISPTATRDLAAWLAERDVLLIDAPVSGGRIGAEQANLSIMAGGDRQAFERIEPVFQAMGGTIRHVGDVGMGQTVKLCNQIVCAIHIQAMCEAFALGRAAGMDLDLVREVILGGAASSWMFEHLGPQVIEGDASAGFRIDLQLKDLRLALDAAFEWGVPLPGASLATSLYLEARAHGEGDNGNQALFRVYDRLTNQARLREAATPEESA